MKTSWITTSSSNRPPSTMEIDNSWIERTLEEHRCVLAFRMMMEVYPWTGSSTLQLLCWCCCSFLPTTLPTSPPVLILPLLRQIQIASQQHRDHSKYPWMTRRSQAQICTTIFISPSVLIPPRLNNLFSNSIKQMLLLRPMPRCGGWRH